ncbi:AurF N-oxygenase family protein [Nocardia caishijiensis]|uniref:Para-aminobenzoate N-oxygenase AurF n=1 Tax=Nocardia caishijiensis TaxID=184756 RepID=A0ABQ6YJJ0_9NOCA|nr:diiron oxygenase [Nocardia caishijiensis]KAF0845950.1 para-aminobenzoate N-oxygenase AurF [Nocardia caishijiensis]
MTRFAQRPPAPQDDQDYRERLRLLSEGSVTRRFDPYLDIDWDAPEMAIDRDDPRWVLSPQADPLGATRWYQQQPLARQIAIGRWRQANAIRVGAAFESILIRGMMQYVFKLPYNSPEFRYCMHEMTEECNHIQMFQELVNRIGEDVPGMRPVFKLISPFIGVAGGYAHTILFIGILGGEEPIDHYQKAVIREGANVPPVLHRCMEIHIAEEARHISFAGDFLRAHVSRMNAPIRFLHSLAFPIAMQWLVNELAAPPREMARIFDIPKSVMRDAFWQSPHSRELKAGYFGDMRALAGELGLMNPVAVGLWRAFGIYGPPTRYRSEPERRGARNR